MKKLLLAAAMAAGLAAPALAQSAATDQPGTDSYGTPSVVARNFTPGAPVSRITTSTGSFSGNLAAQQAYQASTSNPRDWTPSNPFNYDTPGG